MTSQYQTLLNTERAARHLNVSPSFLEKGRIQGYGPRFIKIRGAVRYRTSDLEAWLDSNTRQPGGSCHD